MNTKNINKLKQSLDVAFWLLLGGFTLIHLFFGNEANPESILADAFSRPSLAWGRSPEFFILFYAVLLFAVAAAIFPPTTRTQKNAKRRLPFWMLSGFVASGGLGLGFAAAPELPWGWILGLEFGLLGFVYFISTFLESPS